MAGAALPSEVLEIIEAAAAHPEGFALLTGGNAEAVAILFGVRPQAIEAARELAAEPRRRRAMTEALARSRTKRKRPKAARRIPVPLDARGLLEALDAFPGGRELLRGAPAETVAVLFGAHPFVVDEARELIPKAKPKKRRAR